MKIGLAYTTCEDNDQLLPLSMDDLEGRDNNEDVFRIMSALKKLGHETKSYIVDDQFYSKIVKDKDELDLIFNLCDDGFYHRSDYEPHLPMMLEVLGVQYTGGEYDSLLLTTRKDITKQMLCYHNIPTPRFQVFESEKEELQEELRFPLIIKPSKEHGSIGIREDSVVNNEEELRKKVYEILKVYKQSAIAEEYIDGQEFNVGVIGKEVLPVGEMPFDGLKEGLPKIFCYEAKWVEQSDYYQITEGLKFDTVSKELSKKMKELALKAGEIFRCRDYYRVDFRLGQDGVPYIIDINPNSSLETTSALPIMAQKAGYTYEEFIEKIVKLASKRIKKQTKTIYDLSGVITNQ